MYNEIYLNIIPDFEPPANNEEWELVENWGFKTATTFDPSTNDWIHWKEFQADDLYKYLRSKDLIISYNWDGFDKRILSSIGNEGHLNGLSLIDIIRETTGCRLSLANVARQNGCPSSTRVDLKKLIQSNPDSDSLMGYNVSKIKSLECVVNKGVTSGELNYIQPGGDFELKSIDTSDWGLRFTNYCIPF